VVDSVNSIMRYKGILVYKTPSRSYSHNRPVRAPYYPFARGFPRHRGRGWRRIVFGGFRGVGLDLRKWR
jgi:hypothetical protein